MMFFQIVAIVTCFLFLVAALIITTIACIEVYKDYKEAQQFIKDLENSFNKKEKDNANF